MKEIKIEYPTKENNHYSIFKLEELLRKAIIENTNGVEVIKINNNTYLSAVAFFKATLVEPKKLSYSGVPILIDNLLFDREIIVVKDGGEKLKVSWEPWV